MFGGIFDYGSEESLIMISQPVLVKSRSSCRGGQCRRRSRYFCWILTIGDKIACFLFFDLFLQCYNHTTVDISDISTCSEHFFSAARPSDGSGCCANLDRLSSQIKRGTDESAGLFVCSSLLWDLLDQSSNLCGIFVCTKEIKSS